MERALNRQKILLQHLLPPSSASRINESDALSVSLTDLSLVSIRFLFFWNSFLVFVLG